MSKRQLLRMIDALERQPADRVRLLGDLGISVMAAGIGAGAASSAGMAGGITILGLTIARTTPVGWVIAGAAGAGLAAYGITRLIRSGAMAEGRRAELLLHYREQVCAMQAKEQASSIEDSDRSAFFVSLRTLIERDVMTPLYAFRIIEQVESGRLLLSRANSLVAKLLLESIKPAGTSPGTAPSLPETPPHCTEDQRALEDELKFGAPPRIAELHEVVATRVENVSMGLGITAGVAAAGAYVAAPTGLTAIGVALGLTSVPVIVTAAPIIATVATGAGVVSGATYFYSRWRRRNAAGAVVSDDLSQ